MLVVTPSLLLGCLAKLNGESGRDGTAREAIAGVGAEAPRRIGSEYGTLGIEGALVLVEDTSPLLSGSSSID
jgi:hypothetical protein